MLTPEQQVHPEGSSCTTAPPRGSITVEQPMHNYGLNFSQVYNESAQNIYQYKPLKNKSTRHLLGLFTLLDI